MKIGTIDIGTNSMRLLVADYKNNKIENRKKYVNTTRIGQGVDKDGYKLEELDLSPEKNEPSKKETINEEPQEKEDEDDWD